MRGIKRLAGVVTALVLSACAHNNPDVTDGTTPSQIVQVTITNDGVIPQQPRIVLIRTGGSQPLTVGRLTSLGTESFTVRGQELVGSFRLQADVTGGSVYTSPPFALRGNDHVTWELRRNVVSVRQ
jgi:hypothetical protein